MSGRGILDADMHTLGRWLAEGWRWWIEEIAALAPARLRGSDRAWPRMRFEGGALVPENGAVPKAGEHIVVLLPEAMCLTRGIDRPGVGERDLQRMLAIEAETLLPFPNGAGIVAGRSLGAAAEPGRIRVEVAGIPIEAARAVADAVAGARLVPERIVVRGASIDFAPAMRDAGLVARRRSATPLIWALVGFLVLLNIACIVWRDQAEVERLERLVREQEPAVAIAQAIGRRVEQGRTIVTRSAALRIRQDALRDLELVGTVLPRGAWLQRYVWDGETARLVGYRPAKTDIATALRKSGRFTGVRSMSDETQAAAAGGEPFDLTARIARR